MPEPESRYFDLVDELLRLEEKNLVEPLDDVERAKWRRITRDLFGAPAEGAEKRRFFRVEAAHRAEVVAPVLDSDARVVSLSGGGLFIETSVPARVGDELEISVRFPERQDVARRFRARVCWRAASPLPAGGPTGVGVQFLDLSPSQRQAILAMLRDRLLRSLELTLEKYRFYFERSPDVTVLLDHAGQVLQASEAARTLLATEGATLEGLPFVESVDQASRPVFADALVQARREPSGARCELRLGRGKARVVEALLGPVKTGELDLGVLLAGRDITERVQHEAQRRELERRLYQTDQLATLGMISAGIAHDINNPLAWIFSNLSLLRGRLGDTPPPGDDAAGLDEPSADILEECLEGLTRIRDIVADLRAFSRVGGLQVEPVDVNEALEASLRILRNQIDQVARLEVRLEPLPRTAASFGRVSQIFLNLLTNAARAFERPDVARNVVAVRTWHQDGRIHASVRDNGRGVPDELRAHLFEPFVTGWAALGGTGLGLALAKDTAAALGGELGFTSEVGRGSEFVISLPVTAARDVEVRRSPAATGETTGRPRVLVIDDEPMILRSLERQLRARWDVVTAGNGGEALARLAEGPFDVVLSDVMIPGMSGSAIHAAIEETWPDLAAGMVFMTGGAFGVEERAAIEGLPNAVLEKPFSLDDLEAALRDRLAPKPPRT